MLRSWRVTVVSLSVIIASSIAGACSSSTTHPSPGTDGTPTATRPIGGSGGGADGSADGATAEAGDAGGGDAGDGGGCTSLALTGTLVDRVGVVGEPPASTGGTVVDGTYDLTSYQVYVGLGGMVGPTGESARSSIRLTAGKIEQVLEVRANGPVTTVRTNSTYATSGTGVTIKELCPNVTGGAQRQYTATGAGTGASLVLTDVTTKDAFTFVKR